MPIDVVDVSTADPEVAEAALNDVWGRDRPLQISGDTTDFACELRLASAGAVGSDRIVYTMVGEGSMAPVDFVSMLTVLNGNLDRFGSARESISLSSGAVAIYPQQAELEYIFSNTEVITVRIATEVIDRVAREQLDARHPVRFHGLTPITDAAAAQWRRLSRYVHRELGDTDSAFGRPIVTAQLAELVAGAALTVFPNDAVLTDYRPGAGRVGSASLRRAVEYIETHAHEAVSLTDIANAAGTTGRAAQIAFRKQHGVTPMEYLRRVRLEGAHRDLEAADPMRGATVAEIAERWGFAPSGDFSRAYRERYGVLPSQTLRS